ncbi:MAG: hypothetical protein IJ700_01760 [Bacteroidaceae bacterium]|nr:hypothetical protein [Bacteroidaceae bacterium]
MMAWRTYRSTSARLRSSALALWLLLLSPVAAAQDTLRVEVGDTVKISLPKKVKDENRFFYGVAVGADVVGLAMKAFGSEWSLMEVMARVNLKDKYFPVFEMGLGDADHEGNDLDYRFRTRAPYFRVGIDYNFNKKHNGNRLFLGVRYGFSVFNYDLVSPTPLEDPVWHESQPFSHTSLRGSAHWGEVLLGLETRLWRFIHVGWDARIKFRITQRTDDVGPPWLVPGFGKNDTSGWGGTFKILFEL